MGSEAMMEPVTVLAFAGAIAGAVVDLRSGRGRQRQARSTREPAESPLLAIR